MQRRPKSFSFKTQGSQKCSPQKKGHLRNRMQLMLHKHMDSGPRGMLWGEMKCSRHKMVMTRHKTTFSSNTKSVIFWLSTSINSKNLILQM